MRFLKFLKNKSKNSRTYFKYAIGEIFLVVFGILIALQVNNFNENLKLAKEEKKIPYNIGDYELIRITVDCKKKSLITEKKHIEYSLSDFADDFKINSIRNWKNANCKNMIFNTNTGWSTTQIIQDADKNVVPKLKANFETCSQ